MANYNINAVARRVVLSGSAGTGPYAFTFEIIATTDVNVFLDTTLLTLSTDYTVTINANGTGSVSLNTGTSNVPSTPSASNTVTIVGSRNIERTTDFVTAGDLTASSLNEQLDSGVIFDQQISERVDRAILGSVTDPTNISMQLPTATSRANKYLAFGADGSVVATSGTTSTIVVSTYGQTLLDDADAGTARTTLGLGSVATLSSIPTANIANDAIDQSKIANNAVGSDQIANNAVNNSKMADDSVGASELIDNSVGAAAINISGNGSSGQAIVSDADGSFSYKTLANQGFQSTTGTDSGSGSNVILTRTITPTSTASKILLMGCMSISVNDSDVGIELKRDSTLLVGSLQRGDGSETIGSGASQSANLSLATFFIDEPNTTSQVSYTMVSDRTMDASHNANLIAIEISS